LEEWVRRFGASLPMRMTASWFGPWTYRIQGCGAIKPRLKAGSALIVIPTAPSGAIVLEPFKARPQKRRANEAWVGKKKRKKECTAVLKLLD
jgi:hypothetical protein